MDIKKYLTEKRELVENELLTLLQTDGLLTDHFAAMRYSLMAGGKRIRPILCLAAAEALDCDPAPPAVSIACAIECIHTYSLIHDDLPAMDNDDLRRGKPTNHKVFGEASAILAGDGLLTFAFELMSRHDFTALLTPDESLRIIHILAHAAGPYGMVGGQSIDLASEGKEIPFETLQYLHSCKTGALITASIQTGAVIGHASDSQFEALTGYGEKLGLAFQIVDDILNVVGTEEELGKAAGSDAERNKATYPLFFGVDKSREMVKETVDAALKSLSEFDNKAEPLRELAYYILSRRS